MDYMLGSITIFAGNYAPVGWALCDGTLLPISQNQPLYALLGNIYGGDGRTNFALPDLRGCAPVQAATGTLPFPALALALGKRQGNPVSTISGGSVNTVGTFTLNANQLPAHNHPATVTATVAVATAASDDTASGSILAGGTQIFAAAGTASGALGGVSASVSVGNTGAGAPVTVNATGNVAASTASTQSPVLALNYIICTQGVWPQHP